MVQVLNHIKNGPSGHLFSACLLMEINVIYTHCTSWIASSILWGKWSVANTFLIDCSPSSLFHLWENKGSCMFQPCRTLCCHEDIRTGYKQPESLDIWSLLSAQVKRNKQNKIELHYLLRGTYSDARLSLQNPISVSFIRTLILFAYTLDSMYSAWEWWHEKRFNVPALLIVSGGGCFCLKE